MNKLSATSPWATNLPSKLKVEGFRYSGLKEIEIPGSKSFSNRALIISACAAGESKLTGLLKSDDTYWCIDSLRKSGIKIEELNGSFNVSGLSGKFQAKEPLFIGAAGTIARFLPGVLASTSNQEFQLDSDHTLSRRPILPLLDSLSLLGSEIVPLDKKGHLPLKIKANGLSNGTINLPGNVSSQYLSGLLICAPLAKGDIIINLTTPIVQPNYVSMTIETMKAFGVNVEVSAKFDKFKVSPQTYKSTDYVIESDVSSAGYLFALAAIHNLEIEILNLNKNTLQPDIKLLEILETMGCTYKLNDNKAIIKGTSKLIGGFEFNLNDFSDQALTLGCVAPFADAPITISGVSHIRKHECDRLVALHEGLKNLQIKSDVYEDKIVIHPGQPKPATINTYDDHRVAMSFSILATKCFGVVIENPSCTAKTFPNFFDVMQKFGTTFSEVK